MLDSKPSIKEGSLVTITLNDYKTFSNTYLVHRKLENECILSHPLTPDCFLIKKDEDLNNEFPSMLSPIEKCFFFAKKNENVLGWSTSADLHALSLFLVVRKELTPKQRSEISNFCGKIATIQLNNSASSAINMIRQNKALLDEYNLGLCNSIETLINKTLAPKDKRERYTLFNVAGFILAQLNSN